MNKTPMPYGVAVRLAGHAAQLTLAQSHIAEVLADVRDDAIDVPRYDVELLSIAARADAAWDALESIRDDLLALEADAER